MTTSLFLDTETTNLPLWDKPSDHPDQPRIIQIACELVDDDSREMLDAVGGIVKPDGWVISQKIVELTGITMERAMDEGAPIGELLPQFIDLWIQADQRVAHNEPFDARMVRIELTRFRGPPDAYTTAEFGEKWKTGKAYCTQRNSTGILKLPPTDKMKAANRFHPKSPNLGEAYQFFTGKPLEGAHNAVVDLMALKAVYWGIQAHKAKAA